MNKKEIFVDNLMKWHKKNPCDYPWRKTKSPYKIWIAEIFLQKTKADQVVPIYNTFLSKYSTLKSLSRAYNKDIENILKPLGLYKIHTERLKKATSLIIEEYNGKIPQEEIDLYNLPGSGPYIVNAVQCFAFEKKKALLDTNFVRIYERIFNKRSKLSRPRTDKKLWNYSKKIMGNINARKFNLAMLDFGAQICKKKNPICDQCIMTDICFYYNKNIKNEIDK